MDNEPYGCTLATLRATGGRSTGNCGLVTETKPERTNGDFKSRPPRAWIVCYSHYQNSYISWTTSFLSDNSIIKLTFGAVNYQRSRSPTRPYFFCRNKLD
jgi:hypothetical protein